MEGLPKKDEEALNLEVKRLIALVKEGLLESEFGTVSRVEVTVLAA